MTDRLVAARYSERTSHSLQTAYAEHAPVGMAVMVVAY
jgi:hypothetical protein